MLDDGGRVAVQIEVTERARDEFSGECEMDWREHITFDPSVCHGQACVAGTRVMVAVILDNLAAGLTPAEIVESYPSVSSEAITAALEYAAELARERVIPLSA